VAVRPRITEALAQIRTTFRPTCHPQRIINPPKMDDNTLDAFCAQRCVSSRIKTALDWHWNVQNDPVTELTSARTGGDPAQGFAKAVWRCATTVTAASRDMCPSYRVTRDEQHSAGRANACAWRCHGQIEGLKGEDFDQRDRQRVRMALCVGRKAASVTSDRCRHG
jgi:hypothetical protein